MKIYVIAVGAKMPDWVNTAWDDYAKRLPSDWAIVLKEIKPESRTTGKTVAQMPFPPMRFGLRSTSTAKISAPQSFLTHFKLGRTQASQSPC
jgi:hypothetical protein